MTPKHHIRERFQRRPPDWQMRKQYRATDFGDIIEDPKLLETYKHWLQGNLTGRPVSALVDATPDNPFAFVIVDHKNQIVANRTDWDTCTLREFNHRWGLHFDECAEEYYLAKTEGMQCHAIQQSIDGLERHYHRVIVPQGNLLLIASAVFDPRPGQARETGTYQ